MNKIFSLAAVALFALVVIGCSSGSNSDQEASPNPPPVSDVTDPGLDKETGTGLDEQGSTEPEANPDEQPNSSAAESESFRIVWPAEGAAVETPTITIQGEARVFEGMFRVHVEDGHFYLGQQDVQVEKGAPEWSKFEIELPFEQATSSHGLLIFSTQSAKDGSWTEELMIPVVFQDVNLGGKP